jgi:probable HAF family extracellular repeat protein
MKHGRRTLRSRTLVITSAIAFAITLAAATARATVVYNVTDLGTAYGDNSSEGYAINNQGQVAAVSRNIGWNRSRAALYSDGLMLDTGTLVMPSIPGASSFGYGINSAGQVAGWSNILSAAGQRAFVATETVSGFSKTNLGPMGDANWAYGINASGDVVGQYYSNSDSILHPFVYRGGSYHAVGTIFSGSAQAINDAGLITGQYAGKAFIDDHGNLNNLGALTGGTTSIGYGINASGKVAGTSNIGSDTVNHAFLYDGTTMLDLGTALGRNAEGRSINSSDVVVGNLTSPANSLDSLGFVYLNGSVQDLNTLIDPASGWNITHAYGINDNGWITGYGTNNLGQIHAFILTPVPEPAAAALLGLGGFCSLAWRRRRKD